MLWEPPPGPYPAPREFCKSSPSWRPLCRTRRPWESTPILCCSPEPRVAPPKVWAKGVSSSEMNVSWEPVQQDMNGILLGYEVSAGRDWEGKGAWGRAQGHLSSAASLPEPLLQSPGASQAVLRSTAFTAQLSPLAGACGQPWRCCPAGHLDTVGAQRRRSRRGMACLPLSFQSPALLACSGWQRTVQPPLCTIPSTCARGTLA